MVLVCFWYFCHKTKVHPRPRPQAGKRTKNSIHYPRRRRRRRNYEEIKMKLWGGRFRKETDSLVNDFNSSIQFDNRLYREDIEGSIAHASMLADCGIISREDKEKITSGLQGILADIEAGKIEFTADNEDIHMNVEALLTERIGEAGKRLHTARSRNDQGAGDLRLPLRG